MLLTDACNESIRGILLQVNNDNEEKPVVYNGRSLTKNEKKYSANELEVLSLVWCIEKLHFYLHQIEFDVKVDHKPLQLIYGIKSKPSARIERWQLRLQPYNFNIIYRKGLENIPNFVSRIKSLPPPISKKDKTEDFINFITVNAVLKTITLEEIKNETEKDMDLVTLREGIKNNSYQKLNMDKYEIFGTELTINDGILL